MQIQSGMVDPSKFVRNDQNQVTGVKTNQGTEAKVVDAAQLPEQIEKGDLFIKVGNDKVVQLTLNEASSREDLMKALSEAIDKTPEGEMHLKEGLIKTYLKIAKGQGNIPTGSALESRVAQLEQTLHQTGHGGHVTGTANGNEHGNPEVHDTGHTQPHGDTHGDGHAKPSPLYSALQKYLGAHHPDLSIELSHFSHALHDIHEGKYVKGIGQLVLSLNHAGHHSHALMEGLEHALKPTMDKLNGNPRTKALASILKKTFLEKDPAKSMSRISQLAKLMDGKLKAHDMRALFETLNNYGPEIKAILPDRARIAVERLELQMGAKLPELVTSLMPMMKNVDFSKSMLKFVFASEGVGKTSAVINLMNAVAAKSDSKTFKSVAKFLKMNPYLEAAWKTTLDGSKSATERGAAMVELAKAYQMKSAQFALETGSLNMTEDMFAKMGIQVPEGKTFQEALPEMQAQAQKAMEGLGLNEPENFKRMMARMDQGDTKIGIVDAMADEVGDTLKKLGADNPDDAVKLLHKLGDHSVDEAVETLKKLGLEGKSVQEATELLDKFAPKNGHEILELMEKLKVETPADALDTLKKLGVSTGDDATKILTALGVDNVQDAQKAMKRLKASNLTQATELMEQLGARSVDDAEALLKKLGDNMPRDQVIKKLKSLGVNARDALRHMEKIGANNLEQLYSLSRQLGVDSALDTVKQFGNLKPLALAEGGKPIQTAQDASHFLSSKGMKDPAKVGQVFGTDNPVEALQMMKRMKVKNVAAAEQALKKLGDYGVKSGKDALALMDTLKVNGTDDVIATMDKLGAQNADDVTKLLTRLGVADADKPAQAALDALPKLKADGMKAKDVVAALEKLGIKDAKSGGELMEKLGSSSLSDAVTDLKRLGVDTAEAAVEKLGKLGVENTDQAIDLLKSLKVTNVDDAIKQADTLGLKSAKEIPETLTKLGVESVDEATKLVKELGVESVEAALKQAEKLKVPSKELPAVLKRLGVDNADAAVDALTKMKVPGNDVKAAIEFMDRAKLNNVDEALGTIKALGVDTLEAAAEMGGKYADKVGDGMKAIDAMGDGVSKETKVAMKNLLTRIAIEHPEMEAEALAKTVAKMEKLGLENADNALAILAHMEPKIAAKILESQHGVGVLVHAADKIAPYLVETMGHTAATAGKAMLHIAPRLASSIVKAIPAIGVYPAAKDAIRLRGIALTGQHEDHGKVKHYPNREVRALALMGSLTNQADAALAVAEMAGVGNALLPLQLGMVGGSLTLDLMTEYYNGPPPQEMPKELKGGLKAAVMTASFLHPDAAQFAKEQYGASSVGERMLLLHEGLVEAGMEDIHVTRIIKAAALKMRDPGKLDLAIKALATKSKDLAADVAKAALEKGTATMKQVVQWVGDSKAMGMAKDLIKSGKASIADAAKWFGETKAVKMMTQMVKDGSMKLADVAKGLGKMGADEVKLFGSFVADLAKQTGKGFAEMGKELADVAAKLGDKALSNKMIKGVLDFAGDNLTYYKAMAQYTIQSFVEKGIDVTDSVVGFAKKFGSDAAEVVNKALKAIDETALVQGSKAIYASIKEGISSFLNPVLKNTDEIAQFASKMGLGDEAAGALKKIVGRLDPDDVGPALKALEKVGAEHIDDVLRMMSYLPSGLVSKAFKHAPGIMTDFSKLMVKAIGSRLGKAALKSPELLAKMAGKIGAGLGKAIPLLGVAVSAYDTGRSASIFATGKGFDLFTMESKTYKNAHARGIAAMLTVINGADTALGIADVIPGVNAGSVAAGIGLAVTSTVLDITMDYIEDNPDAMYKEPLSSFRSTIEIGSMAAAAVMGPVALYKMYKLYDASAEDAGRAIARAMINSKDAPDVGKTIAELGRMIQQESGGLWTGDEVAKGMFRELKKQGYTLKELMNPKGRPNPYEGGKRLPPLSAKSVDTLMDNLEGGWTTNEEYGYLDQLAEVAPVSSKVKMLERLLGDWFNGDRSEQLITKLLPTDSAQLNKVLGHLSSKQIKNLGTVLDDNQTRFNDIFRRIADSNNEQHLKDFIHDVSASQLEKAVTSHLNAGSKLSNSERFMLFEKAVEVGNFDLMSQMLNGVPGKMGRMTDARTQQKMIGILSKDINHFMSVFGGRNNQAGQISSWVLAYGSQSQIDSVFRNVNSTYKSWFGNGGDIVKRAISFAESRRPPVDLANKLSLSTLKSMMGGLNGTWTKLFGNYSDNLKYVEKLAKMVDVNGKAAIVKNLMDGWTTGEAEGLIADIFKNTTDPKEFTHLMDKVGPKRLASELGDSTLSYHDRKRVGEMMAYVVERYSHKDSLYSRDDDKVLRDIMSTWGRMSIMTDDFIEHMVRTLEKDGKLGQLKKSIDNSTMRLMIDWANDAFRDGNVMDLDPSTKRAIAKIRAQM